MAVYLYGAVTMNVAVTAMGTFQLTIAAQDDMPLRVVVAPPFVPSSRTRHSYAGGTPSSSLTICCLHKRTATGGRMKQICHRCQILASSHKMGRTIVGWHVVLLRRAV